MRLSPVMAEIGGFALAVVVGLVILVALGAVNVSSSDSFKPSPNPGDSGNS